MQDVHALVSDWWDPAQRLLTDHGGVLLAPTVWWAYGLLRRDAPGDRARAEVALRSVVDRHGQEQVPVGVGLALVLRDHRLPPDLTAVARAAVERMVDDLVAAPVDVTRTSEVVQRAWLELEVGRWRSDERLLAAGAGRARAVAADAGVRGHVAEHAGPTATGTTLLGLSLWAERPPVEDLGPLGRALRDEVWHDLLAIWHPGLQTLVPPFSHAHGMDLRTHVGATGLWLAWLVDGVAPLPPLREPPLHRAQDLPLVFLVDALAGASEDVRALAPLVRAQPARQGEWYDRVGDRVWTGWTGGTLAVGAEWSPVDQGGRSQVVTAAAVWRADDGANAWLRLHQGHGPVEARVETHDRDGTTVVRLAHGTTGGPVQLWLGGAGPTVVTPDRVAHGGRAWSLQGVREVVEVPCDVPQVGAAWRLVPTAAADGIALHVEV